MSKTARKQTRQFLESITDPKALKKQGYIPMTKWGKDHWSLLGYIGCRNVDHDCIMDGNHLRVNENRHVGIARHPGGGRWDPKAYGTRLHGHFENKNDKTAYMPEHDDIDCAEDMEAEGLVVLGTTISLYAQLTKKGQEIEAALRKHKQDGGNFADFLDTNGCKALMLKFDEEKA